MTKQYTSLGLMSGTSGDGVDASIIQSNGDDQYKVIEEQYFQYDNHIYQKIHSLKEKINNFQDLDKLDNELNNLERIITLFHVDKIKKLRNISDIEIIGFHGQTIYHNPSEKISKQLGNGKLLAQLTNKKIVYNFRQNDILNGGEGAPLAPVFHQLLVAKTNLELPVCVLNIGGISNMTIVEKKTGVSGFSSRDIGPGNCLIDDWIRKKTEQKFDNDGSLASAGKVNEIILEQVQELFSNRFDSDKISFDTSDFDVSFARGLSLEDGAATLTDFTANIISSALISSPYTSTKKPLKVLLCGGGRKNKTLIQKIEKNTFKKVSINLIDKFGVNGDFIESQAFAYLAIRSSRKLPISFPKTTGCKEPITGGEII